MPAETEGGHSANSSPWRNRSFGSIRALALASVGAALVRNVLEPAGTVDVYAANCMIAGADDDVGAVDKFDGAG
jgi:hypothetical protein